MSAELTKEFAYQALQEFFAVKPFVLFATGASCAVDLGFGMPALECYLKARLPELGLTDRQQAEWSKVVADIEASSDFEAAMNSIEDLDLLKKVIGATASHVCSVQNNNIMRIVEKEAEWSAIRIIKSLVAHIPQADPVLHVATPNYDLLAEYAFCEAGIPYSTGFWGGVLKVLNWEQAGRQMTYVSRVMQGKKLQLVTKYKNHIRLYKVHGSLNTFCKDRQVVECDSWDEAPAGYERLIITPGTSKHERLHDYRDVLLGEYDRAVKAHSSFLFLGFGFNDTQLVNNAISEKLIKEACPALIITRDVNDRIDTLMNASDNVWVVCKAEHDESTRIFNKKYGDWLALPDKELWQFDLFANEIMGQ
jgi:SIR2-like domain